MKIRVIKKEEGVYDVYLQRTRPNEGRNVYLKGVASVDLHGTVGSEVRKMRGESEVESPEGA